MGKAGNDRHVEADHFKLGRQRRVGKWPAGGEPGGKNDETNVEVARLLLELIDALWLCKVSRDNQGLYPVCRREIASDGLKLIAASRGKDDINAPRGNLGGQRLTNPIACSRD
jgi:hypothetical protein